MIDGRRISHYEVLERVGSGGMGTVYKARDTRLGREVALKLLPSTSHDSAEARERFLTEARAASMIDHPSICTVHDIGEADDGALFISMGYCRGRTLEQRLQEGALPADEAVALARQIASGLAAAHAAGIVHRDVKPSNVIVDDQQRVKIVDFGIAKLADSHLTRDGSSLGTTAYMAPEQVRAEDVDARADVWGFGVLLYQMLSGRLPFQAPYEQAVGYRILHEAPDELDLSLPEHLRGLEEILNSCLQKEAAMRPATMEDVARALDDLRETGNQRIAKPRAALFSTNRLLAGRHRQVGMMSLGILVLVIAGLSIVLRGDAAALPTEKYLVVLPLTMDSENHDDQALADGLTTTLATQLAQLSSHTDEQYWVVPQSEVRSLGVDHPSAARRLLGATLVVEGAVVRTQGEVRLTMNLVETTSLKTIRSLDFAVPSDRLDRLQNETARRVAEMLGVEARPEFRLSLDAGRTRDPRAYDFYLRGMAHLERYELKENLEAAADLFTQAIERDRDFASAMAARGEAQWRLYETTKDEIYVSLATRDLQRALALEPRLAHAHVTLARVYAGTDRLAEALAEVDLAIELEPGSVDAVLMLARLRDRSGLVDDAEATYLEAISMRPAYWAAYNQLGAFYSRRGRFNDAATQFGRVVLLTPDNVRGYSNLGAAYLQLGRLEEARASFETSVSLEPTYAGLSNLASLYFFGEDMSRAASTYRRALELEDGDYRAWLFLSLAEDRLGRSAEAHRAKEEAVRRASRQIQLNPGDQRATADLADMLVESDSAKARELLEGLITHPVGDVDVMVKVAEVFEQLGDRSAAFDWICNALSAGFRLDHVEERHALEGLRADPRYERMPTCLSDS